MSVIIADAGPLIGLAHLQQLELLHQVFGEVLITNTVHAEILPTLEYADKTMMQAALEAGWLKVVDVDMGEWQPFYAGVDAGEGSAIYLASQLNHALLIIDDRAGRAEAKARKLRIIGTAAVISLAKLKGLIPQARPLLYALRASGYRLSDAVIQAVLDDVGE